MNFRVLFEIIASSYKIVEFFRESRLFKKKEKQVEITTMSPSLIMVLLNLGKIMQSVRDLEKCIADAVAGHPTKEDLQAIGKDISALFQCGLISIPGITAAQVQQVIADLQKIQ